MRDEGDEEEGVGSPPPRFSHCSAGLKAQVPVRGSSSAPGRLRLP